MCQTLSILSIVNAEYCQYKTSCYGMLQMKSSSPKHHNSPLNAILQNILFQINLLGYIGTIPAGSMPPDPSSPNSNKTKVTLLTLTQKHNKNTLILNISETGYIALWKRAPQMHNVPLLDVISLSLPIYPSIYQPSIYITAETIG